MTGLDANEVIPNLWQGSKPPIGRLPFDILVLCAKEYQPRGRNSEVVVRYAIFHAPMDDAWISPEEQATALTAGQAVAAALQRRQTVLSTCYMGFNRSGLVSALAMMFRGASADEAIQAVRRARGPSALSNDSFVQFLRKVDRSRPRAHGTVRV